MDTKISVKGKCPKCSGSLEIIQGVFVPYCPKGHWSEMDETHIWDKQKQMLVRRSK